MAASDPLRRFERLFEKASAEAPFDPTAASLATADADGKPSVRVVLLKGWDERGFRFFTNYGSRKALELAANPRAALCCYWPWIDLQVRIEGRVERLPDDESDDYFATRPRGSQLSAWASQQSRPLDSRFGLLRRVLRTEARFLGRPVGRPEEWGGYLLRPENFEFWVSRPNRLHVRTLYSRRSDGWESVELQP